MIHREVKFKTTRFSGASTSVHAAGSGAIPPADKIIAREESTDGRGSALAVNPDRRIMSSPGDGVAKPEHNVPSPRPLNFAPSRSNALYRRPFVPLALRATSRLATRSLGICASCRGSRGLWASATRSSVRAILHFCHDVLAHTPLVLFVELLERFPGLRLPHDEPVCAPPMYNGRRCRRAGELGIL